MVPAEEMRQRYKEHIELSPVRQELQVTDITTRRRLSTPKASPLPKRTSSPKSSKISHISSHQSSDISSSVAPKSGWFMSLDRLSRKKTRAEKAPEVSKWASTTTKILNRPTTNRSLPPSSHPSSPARPSLRFFGDTDIENIDASLSKAATQSRARKPLYNNIKLSQSVYDLDSTPRKPLVVSNNNEKLRSTSLQQLHQPTIHERDRYEVSF